MPEDPTRRALTLLSLLQPGAAWPAEALAARLGVGVRTVRRDVSRLRDLGYAVEARPGPASVYRLVPGVSVPPLLFTGEEVAALVAGLRLLHPRLDDDETVAGALAKLEQVLPPALRRRADAQDLAMEVLEGDAPGIPTWLVGAVADAVAESGRVRFDYRDGRGVVSQRLLDPHRHVLGGSGWYLVGFDVGRDDWRTFRLDRVTGLERVPGVYRRRAFPAESVAGWFGSDFGRAT